MKKKSIRNEISGFQSYVGSQFSLLRIAVGLFIGMLMVITPVFSTVTSGEISNNDLNTNTNWNSVVVPETRDAVNSPGIMRGVSPSSYSPPFNKGFSSKKLSGVNNYTAYTGHPSAGKYLDRGELLTQFIVEKLSLGRIWDALFGTGSGGASNKEDDHPEPTTVDDFIDDGEGDLVLVNNAGQNEQTNEQEIAVITESIAEGFDKFQNQDMVSEEAEVMMTDRLMTGSDPGFVYATLGDGADFYYNSQKTNIKRLATTHNQHAIAAQLDEVANWTTGQNLLLRSIVNAPLSEIPEKLDSLSGYQYTNDLFTTELVSRQFLRRLYDPIRCSVTDYHNRGCDSCYDRCYDWTGWLEAGGTRVHLNNSKNARGFNMKGYEITAGAQKLLGCDWTLGFAGSYENDNYHYKHGDGSEKSATWLSGIYGLYRPSEFYGLVDFAYGQSSNKMHRKIATNTLDYSAHGKPDTSQFVFYGEIGVDFRFYNCLFQPFAGIQADWYRRKRFTETSSDGIELAFHRKERSSATSRIGFHLTSYGFADLFNVSLDLAWNARLTGFNNNISGQFVKFGNEFEIEGTKINRNSIDYAVTISTGFCSGWEVYLEGSGESWNKAQLYNILCGVKWSW